MNEKTIGTGNPFAWVKCGHPTLPEKQEDCYVCMNLQLSEWRKVGEGLKADIMESLAQEGMGAGDTPASHYSASYNRLLELLKEAK